jgi:hypothetical protein
MLDAKIIDGFYMKKRKGCFQLEIVFLPGKALFENANLVIFMLQ